jgi:kynurenine formamidase
VISRERELDAGHSCNASHLALSAHAGTHVDAPRHFLAAGRGLDAYDPATWIFECPQVVPCPVDQPRLIGPEDIGPLQDLPQATDLVLLHTGFGRLRHMPRYWQAAPGLAPALAEALQTRLPHLRAVGMDLISVSSLVHRDAGRTAHREFLSRGILLIEDMDLNPLRGEGRLVQVVALPLRYTAADGAPCTVIGRLQ